MDKEKEIQEMNKIVDDYCNKAIAPWDQRLDGEYNRCRAGDCEYCAVEALYAAGYRKADEVRKKTAEEILQRIYNLFIFAEESEQKIVIDATYICDFAEREYGVEVEG